MKQISVAIIACNEEQSLGRTLESVSWADEVLVVDSGSTDRTVEIAREAGARVVHRDWTGFVDQKNHATDQAAHDWIFSLDADEVCSPVLATAIQHWQVEADDGPRGYRLSRLSWFMGRWIHHTTWSPDYQLRLFDRRAGRWEGGRVHESVRVTGEVGVLPGKILHYTYVDLGDYLEKMDAYTALASRDMYDRGRRASGLRLLVSPLGDFIKSYFFKRGFLDGVPGLVVSGLGMMSKFFRYARLYELSLSADKSDEV